MGKIGVQLYSIREECNKNFIGTIKEVAGFGYKGIEFYGNIYYGMSAKELKKILDDLGLKTAGVHISVDKLTGDELKKTVEFHEILENKFLIIPYLSEKTKSGWIEKVNIINEISDKLKTNGMFTGYHNHDQEFHLVENELPWDIFFSRANPDVVMQVDTGNAMFGGVSAGGVIDILRKYPNRAKSVHLKEYPFEQIVVGEGEFKWKEFVSTCENTEKTEWYIIEQESQGIDTMEYIRKSYENLKKMEVIK